MSGTTDHSVASLPLWRPRTARIATANEPVCIPDAAETTSLAQPLSMRTNVFWNFLGNVVYAVSRWAMVVVLANVGNTEMIGLVILAFALGAPLYSLTNLGLRNALVTDVRRQCSFQDYLGLRLITSAFAAAAVGVMVWGMGYPMQLVWLSLLVGTGRFFESISDLFHGLLQRQERMDRIGIAITLREPAAVLFLAVVVCLTGSVVWGMVGFPLAMAATLFLYDIPNGVHLLKAPTPSPNADRLAPRWRLQTMLRLSWTCVPLGLIMTTITLQVNIPRYAVEHYLGTGALGVFASLAYISTASGTLLAAIGQSASPRLAKHYAAKNTTAYYTLVGRLLLMVAAIGLGLAGLIALAGRPILRVLYGPELAAYAPLAVTLMTVAVLSNLCGPLGRALDGMRRFWTHMFIRIAGILTLMGLVPVLVQSQGLEGAAAAVALSSGVSILLYASVLAAALVRMRDER